MAEFTQTMSGDSRYSIKLTVTEVIPSDYVTTNKTNANYTLTATKASGSGYWNNNANNPVKVTINGTDVVNTNVAYDFRNATPKTITLASGTVTGIEHNADGSKTIAVSGYFKDNGNSLGQATASGNLTLTTIPRASQPIVYDQNDQIRRSATLGESLKIETFRASNSFTHTINIKIGNTTVEGPFNNIGDEKNPWTPAVSTYAPYISTQSATATIECTTYNGSTNLGTKTYTITLTVPRNSTTKPVANISISKGDTVVPDAWGVYVKGKSKLAVTISGTPYHTTIKTYSSTTNGATNTNSSYTTGELTTVGENEIKATVTDNRNYTSDEASQTYTVQDYFTPTLTLTVERCNSSGAISDDGTYIKYSLTGDIASVSSKNNKSFVLKYREKTGNTWTQIFSNTSNYSISASGTQYPASSSAGVFNIEKEYVFRLEAEDYFYKSANNNTVFIEQEIGTVADLLNFNEDGTSLAVGGVSTRSSKAKYFDIYNNVDLHQFAYGKYRNYPVSQVGSDSSGTAGWYKVCSSTMSGWGDQNFTWLVTDGYRGSDLGHQGILNLSMRSNNGSIALWNLKWLIRGSGMAYNCVRVVISSNTWTLYIKREIAQYGRIYFIELENNSINGIPNPYTVTYYNSSSPESSEPSSTNSSSDGGYTLYSSIANSASTATNATNDQNGTNIVNYYSRAGNTSATSFDDVGSSGKLKRSGLYTESIGNVWYNIINVRHRNGESDGTNYGLQIRSAFSSGKPALQYRSQGSGTWGSWVQLATNIDKGCAMLQLNSNWSFSGVTAWANVQVAFSGRSGFLNSNSDLFEQSGNGIKCKFAGWVQITGVVSTDKTNEFDACILNGSTQLIRPINTGGRQSFVTRIAQVANGDIIYLGFASSNTSGTIYNGTHYTVTRIS